MNEDNTQSNGIPLFAGSMFEGLPSVQEGSIAFVDAPSVGACFIIRDDIAIGIQRSSLDAISSDLIEDTPEGGKPHRIVFTECRAVIGLTQKERDFLLGLTGRAPAAVLPAPSARAEATQAEATQAAREDAPAAPVQGQLDLESGAAPRAAAKAQAKPAQKTAKAPAEAKSGTPGPKAAKQPEAKAAKAKPEAKAAPKPPAKAAQAKTPAKAPAKSTASTPAKAAKPAPAAAQAAPAKAPAKAGASSGAQASVQEVIDTARRLIDEAGQPLPRRRLFEAMTRDLGMRIPGKDPIENLATILYKDKNHAFMNIKGRGFWLSERPVPPSA